MNERSFKHNGLLNAWVGYCNSSRVIPAIMPIICLLFQTTFLQRITYFYPHQLTEQPVPALLIALLFMVPPLLLLMRRRFPDQILIAQLLVLICARWLDLSMYFELPILLAVYTVVARSKISHAITLTLLSTSVYLFTMNGEVILSLSATIPKVTTFSVAVLMGLISRALWAQHQNYQLQIANQAQVLKAQIEAQKISAQNRIAAQLHDSVGHNLTALITLSESLLDTDEADDKTAPPQAADGQREVIRMINSLARKGLADTRKAVDALSDPNSFPHEVHHLDDIHDDIAALSSLNIPIELHEHGIRNLDQQEEDLFYHVMREALTNALKHSGDLKSVSFQIDYGATPSDSARLRIVSVDHESRARDDYGATPSADEGTLCSHIEEQSRVGGLERLASQVTKAGGTMSYGFIESAGIGRSHQDDLGDQNGLKRSKHAHALQDLAAHFIMPERIWEVSVELPRKDATKIPGGEVPHNA